VCDLAELPDHGCSHVLHGLHAAEFIGIGEEIAFERRRAGSEVGDEGGIGLRYFQEVLRRAESGSFDGARDVEHSEALRNDYGAEVDVAAGEAFVNVDHIPGFIEPIFSGFERSAAVQIVPQDECFLGANDPGGLEFGGDAARGVSGAQHHEGFPRRFGGSQQSPGEPARGSERRNKDKPEDLAHDGDSLDDERRGA